jgi:diacylglycerol kinase (ATP)
MEQQGHGAVDLPEEFRPASGLGAVFRAAYNGLIHTVSTQRNMKIHWVSGFMVMLVGMAIPLDLGARAALFFSVFLILFAEILNSALEAFVDLHIRAYHYQAKLAKDAAAAGVLILAVAVVILFFDILWHFQKEVFASGEDIVRTLVFGGAATLILIWALFFSAPRSARFGQVVAALGLLVPLAWHSRDHFFSFGASCFVMVGVHSRIRFPDGKR